MGLVKETLTAIVPSFRALEEGPLPLTAARVVEWLGGEPTATGQRVNQQTALGLTAVWDAVDMVSGDIARTPVPLYRRDGKGREKADTDRLYYLLNTAPNPFMTAFEFKQALQGHKMLWGNAFANIERNPDGSVRYLWPLRPDRMERPVLSAADTPSLVYPYTLENGTRVLLAQSEVLHIRGLSLDGIWGMSQIALHRETIALGMAYRQFEARFFGNNATLGLVLEAKTRLTKDAAERLKTGVEEAHRGMTNAFRTMVLEEGITAKTVGMPLADAQFIESMKLNRIEVASIWHIPAHKIGELDRATFTNIEEQDLDYEGAVLDREYALWDQQLNKDLLLPGSPLYFEHLRNALVRSTIEKRYDAYSKAWWLIPNEIRAKENENNVAGFDEPFIPVNNYLPLSVALKQAEAAMAAPTKTSSGSAA